MARNTTKNAYQLARVVHSVFDSKKLFNKASKAVLTYYADYLGDRHHVVANEPFGGIMSNDPKSHDGFVMKRKAFRTVLFACLTGKKKALTAAIEVLQAELGSSPKKEKKKDKPKTSAKKDKATSSDSLNVEDILG
tara:strand:- start:747 stop:1154 length:408 start_codon:yes stop_codon:yes gene_type:complete